MQLWINMSASNDMTAVQDCIDNRLDAETIGDRLIAGVIGEAPSRYSKSPALWNSVFRELSINGIYVPLDVEPTRLTSLAAAFKNCDRLLGVNVTVPHKLAIMEHLDKIDSNAARIGSVNTVVRSNDGRLIGYNTDGEGFVDSIFKIHPGQAESFLDSLRGADVLLLGAGGSARAVAFHVSQLLDGGKLIICNRTVEQARALADEVRKAGHHVQAIGEEELPYWAPKVTLIINSTTK
ncbi:MAG: shikimate dehydrogenase, partial [Deltaproteobacteria bacterium]|nr:shikimate dehydrogenase [Deltaproteobacteria bacterium]